MADLFKHIFYDILYTTNSTHLSSFFFAAVVVLKALWVAYVPSAVTRRCTLAPVICVSSSLKSPAALCISSSTIGICYFEKYQMLIDPPLAVHHYFHLNTSGRIIDCTWRRTGHGGWLRNNQCLFTFHYSPCQPWNNVCYLTSIVGHPSPSMISYFYLLPRLETV